MDFYGHEIRDQLKNSTSYSSLPAGLEIAVAPSYVMSPPERTSRYTYTLLPRLPSLPGESSYQLPGNNEFSNSLDITPTRRLPTFPVAKRERDPRGSTKKIEKLPGHKLDHVTRQPALNGQARNGNKAELPQLPEVVGLSKLDHHNHVDTFSDIHRYMRSDSDNSLSSASAYSQDDIVEEIVDIYSKWHSWAPNPESPTLPVKRPLYLQPSSSATELGHASQISNVRRPRHASLGRTQISPKAATLSELITEEREHFGGNRPRDESRLNRGDRSTPSQDRFSLEANNLGYLPWNDDGAQELNSTPQPLALRPKDFHEPHRSMSQWSDYSADGGIILNARDSVMSHICSISPPFKVPSRPSMVFKEKAATSTIQVLSPEHTTRKRVFSRGRHPLKSPFPFRSPLHKTGHSDYPPTSKKSSFGRRISESFKHISGTRNPPIIDSRIISNHARTGDGPDTPMPTKTGFMDIISPTAILFQKGTLQIQDAMHKAKRATRVRSKGERRRDRLRKMIVVVGTSDPSPTVSRWV